LMPLLCDDILLILLSELNPLEADDSLERSETVSLKAESLSGLSVRDSLTSVDVAVTVDIVEIVEIVEFTPETIELDRLCVCTRLCRIKSPLFCSRMLSSVRIESSSDSCVSSKFAIENLYELMRSLFGTVRDSFDRSLTGDC
jgi:hypothetical protein